MSRSEPDKDQPERYYIGRNKPKVEISTDSPLHWHEAWLMGYRATPWPKIEADRDDIRYDIKEKEIHDEL